MVNVKDLGNNLPFWVVLPYRQRQVGLGRGGLPRRVGSVRYSRLSRLPLHPDIPLGGPGHGQLQVGKINQNVMMFAKKQVIFQVLCQAPWPFLHAKKRRRAHLRIRHGEELRAGVLRAIINSNFSSRNGLTFLFYSVTCVNCSIFLSVANLNPKVKPF